MFISDVRAIPLQIPFSTGGPAAELNGHKWFRLDYVLVRVEMDDGTVG